jgi:glutathione-regulated potassium-efflux system ancillary protein KefC
MPVLEPVIILVALLCGMASRALRFPALIGYLAAGFVLHEFSMETGPILDVLAELGITLLLFTIGLKLEPKKLLESKVWGTTFVHMAVTQTVMLALLLGVTALVPAFDLDWQSGAIIAFGLTFSSTVFVVQTMEERGELGSAHAALAIGVLIVQDLVAVIFLALSAGKVPQLSALGLLLIIPLRPVVLRILSLAGYGELLTLLGLAVAIGAAQVSELVGVKGDLGALFVGAVLAGHPKSKAMASNLIQLKDLFLVGFFLSIGLGGWPEPHLIVLAVLIGLLAALKPLLYFPLMTRFHTSPRTAVLAAGALGNHSEFGLIVVSVAAVAGWVDPQWSAALSIAIAVSFVIAAPMSSRSHHFYAQHRDRLLQWQSGRLRESFEPTDGVKVVILGMGRVGTGAYESLAPQFGSAVLGVEASPAKVAEHRTEQRRVVTADASDPDFWHRVNLSEVELIMLALTNHSENRLVAELLHSMDYRGQLAAVVRHADHAEEMQALGISAFNLYGQAGAGFAAHACDLMESQPEVVQT